MDRTNSGTTFGNSELALADDWLMRVSKRKTPNQQHHLPTLRHGADVGLFLGFAAEAGGEELVQERLFQFGGQRQQPLLLLHRPLHQPQHRRNLPLLGEGVEVTSKASPCLEFCFSPISQSW